MRFNLEDAARILTATPETLRALLGNLPEPFARASEGPGTWSPYDIVGHLIHGEKTRTILEHGETIAFAPFDRDAQFRDSAGRSLTELLDEFAHRRTRNLADLAALRLQECDLDQAGRHPVFGRVTLRELLATWVAHDCDHLMQLSRVIGRQYADEVGPWRAYLRVISGQQG